MGWTFWRKDNTPKMRTYSVEAYAITTLGLERQKRTHTPTLSYEGIKMLLALKYGEKMTAGQLADECSWASVGSKRRAIEELVKFELISREDLEIRVQSKR